MASISNEDLANARQRWEEQKRNGKGWEKQAAKEWYQLLKRCFFWFNFERPPILRDSTEPMDKIYEKFASQIAARYKKRPRSRERL